MAFLLLTPCSNVRPLTLNTNDLVAGQKVTLVEKNMFMGGNSTKATSGINGAGTRTQKAMAVPDDKEIFEEDTVR